MDENNNFYAASDTTTKTPPTVTCAEMKEIERAADAAGLSYYQMMENAGSAAAELILSRCGSIESAGPRRAVIFCGKGNNGGDGYVAARKLSEAGHGVVIVAVEGPPKTKDAAVNARIAAAIKIPLLHWPTDTCGLELRTAVEAIHTAVSAADIIVDAIYGTGFHGKLSDAVLRCTAVINSQKSGTLVYALDIPSGLSGDSGEVSEGALRADCTIVFHRKKPVHDIESAKPHCGEILTVGIGID